MERKIFELIKKYRFGTIEESNHAISQILTIYAQKLYFWYYRILRNEDDSKDCLQKLAIFFITRSPEQREKDFSENNSIGSISSFLYRTVSTKAINFLKRESTPIEIIPIEMIDEVSISDSDDKLIIEHEKALHEAINNLDKETKDFTLLWLSRPKRKSEIMSILNIS